MPDVTPDDDNDGVEVWRQESPANPYNSRTHVYGTHEAYAFYSPIEPGRWFTTLRAEQLLAGEWIVKIAREVQMADEIDADPDALDVTLEALYAALDALRPAAPGTPE